MPNKDAEYPIWRAGAGDRAIVIIQENAVWDSVLEAYHPGVQANIVDAVMQAVAEEREACAAIAEYFNGGVIAAVIRNRGKRPEGAA